MKRAFIYLMILSAMLAVWCGASAIIAVNHNRTSEAKASMIGVMIGETVQSGPPSGEPPDPNMPTADTNP